MTEKDKEYKQIALALTRWLQTQDVDLADAAVVMATMIAQITARISKSESEMDKGVQSFVKGFQASAAKFKNAKFGWRL
jgi:hypothetical protein